MQRFKTRDELLDYLEDKALGIRKKIIELTVLGGAGGSHVGGSLSETDILVALYHHILKYDPKNPSWPERDRFILSKGHGALGLYPVLADVGYFSEELFSTFHLLDSPFGWHPDMKKLLGIEMSTGSLGHGLSVAIGVALSARLEGAEWRTYCLLGDGELDEGTVWEAAMSAAHYKLGNLIAIVDRNGLSLDGPTEEVMALNPLKAKWEAFGWNGIEIDGHNMQQLVDTLESLPPPSSSKPMAIIANTVKGKGVSFMENAAEWHMGGLSAEKAEEVLAELESNRPPRRCSQ